MSFKPVTNHETRMSNLSEEEARAYKANADVFKGGKNKRDIVEYYNTWAENGDYDKHLDTAHYSGPEQAARVLSSHFEESERGIAKIIDVAAGTGKTGEELYKLGFRNIDALDPSEGMLSKAKERGVYKYFIQDFIDVDNSVPVANGTYDGLTCSGGFGQGHIPATALREMIRIMKPGGIICIVSREEYINTAKQYKDTLIPMMTELEVKGLWSLKSKYTVENYAFGLPGVVFTFQVQ